MDTLIIAAIVIACFTFMFLFPPPMKDTEVLELTLSVFPKEHQHLGLIKLLKMTFEGDETSVGRWCHIKDQNHIAGIVSLKSYLKTKSLTDSIKQEDFNGSLSFNEEGMKEEVEKLISEFDKIK